MMARRDLFTPSDMRASSLIELLLLLLAFVLLVSFGMCNTG